MFEPYFLSIVKKGHASYNGEQPSVPRRKPTMLALLSRGIKRTKKVAINTISGTSQDILRRDDDDEYDSLKETFSDIIDDGDVAMIKSIINGIRDQDVTNAFQTVFARLCRMDSNLELEANMKQYEEIIDMLFTHGANINSFDRYDRWAPIQYSNVRGHCKTSMVTIQAY